MAPPRIPTQIARSEYFRTNPKSPEGIAAKRHKKHKKEDGKISRKAAKAQREDKQTADSRR
jgi:hypothetical protein